MNILYDDINNLDDEHIQDVVNHMDQEDCNLFIIKYCNDIFDDFKNNLHDSIEEESIYFKLCSYIYDSEQSKKKIAAQEQLDKDNYYHMCLRNDVPIYLNTVAKSEYDINDFTIVVKIGDTTMLSFSSPQNDYDEYYVDLITADNGDSVYMKFYIWDDDNNELLLYEAKNQGELEFNVYNDDDEMVINRFIIY